MVRRASVYYVGTYLLELLVIGAILTAGYFYLPLHLKNILFLNFTTQQGELISIRESLAVVAGFIGLSIIAYTATIEILYARPYKASVSTNWIVHMLYTVAHTSISCILVAICFGCAFVASYYGVSTLLRLYRGLHYLNEPLYMFAYYARYELTTCMGSAAIVVAAFYTIGLLCKKHMQRLYHTTQSNTISLSTLYTIGFNGIISTVLVGYTLLYWQKEITAIFKDPVTTGITLLISAAVIAHLISTTYRIPLLLALNHKKSLSGIAEKSGSSSLVKETQQFARPQFPVENAPTKGHTPSSMYDEHHVH